MGSGLLTHRIRWQKKGYWCKKECNGTKNNSGSNEFRLINWTDDFTGPGPSHHSPPPTHSADLSFFSFPISLSLAPPPPPDSIIWNRFLLSYLSFPSDQSCSPIHIFSLENCLFSYYRLLQYSFHSFVFRTKNLGFFSNKYQSLLFHVKTHLISQLFIQNVISPSKPLIDFSFPAFYNSHNSFSLVFMIALLVSYISQSLFNSSLKLSLAAPQATLFSFNSFSNGLRLFLLKTALMLHLILFSSTLSLLLSLLLKCTSHTNSSLEILSIFPLHQQISWHIADNLSIVFSNLIFSFFNFCPQS